MRTLIFISVVASAVMIGSANNLNAVQTGGDAAKTAPSAAGQNDTPQAKATPVENPTKKLGAFLGKWETEGAFASGQKTSTSLECRWSPQGAYLVCDQLVRIAGEHRQFTVYSYNSKDGNYSYTTLADPGAKPSTGAVKIEGNLWTYDSSFDAGGKTTLIRTTNEFLDPKTEVFKVASSDDGGAHWKTVLEGKARKIAD